MVKLRTYIVEDSPVIRENLVAALEEMVPLQVVGFAEDEASAVQWLREPANDCQLGIIDIFLRRGSGLGVLQAMRDSGKALRLVVLSNFATPDIRRRCLELGADKVFDKSNEIDSLIRYCERLAAGGDPGDTGAAPLDAPA
ncbi:response regulator [Rivibacter subsaxonicus]|uniref:Response regulator receiver domain-containing protein n=1 Tax=Rivibacter subsaxonicus TaxID=457575 RepID=A0A4Q7VN77_9BURK|nr:response regulator [Rivibacter subsaxonicus]RZT97762.1 response regulator receiver domain-containing protein [Rivibacter subsaxonicus]